MKKEPTSDNIEQYFGYKSNGCRFSDCIKCRSSNRTRADEVKRKTDQSKQDDDQSTSQDSLLVCGRCKCKKESTNDNISTYFGYKSNGCRFSNCIKCQLKNKQYSTTRTDAIKDESGERETRADSGDDSEKESYNSWEEL